MKTWIRVPPVVLNTWSGHTLTGGNGRGDGSATSVRIDVILAAGEAGLCRTSSQNLNRVAMIAVRRVSGATAHGAAKRLAADLNNLTLQKIDFRTYGVQNVYIAQQRICRPLILFPPQLIPYSLPHSFPQNFVAKS